MAVFSWAVGWEVFDSSLCWQSKIGIVWWARPAKEPFRFGEKWRDQKATTSATPTWRTSGLVSVLSAFKQPESRCPGPYRLKSISNFGMWSFPSISLNWRIKAVQMQPGPGLDANTGIVSQGLCISGIFNPTLGWSPKTREEQCSSGCG